MLEILGVLPGGTAARHGIRPGDRLVSVNGHEVRDCIDAQFLAADERITVEILRSDGSRRRVRIDKTPDDMLGVELPRLAVRRCRNRCIFCFVDQMPAGCRRSLSVKDDDYRASFLFGNYVTLGNLLEDDWERILSQRLSPLYISVHATDPDLRKTLLRNRNAPDILPMLRRLADGGIRLHTQIVLCPGINDGDHLVRTVVDLASLAPAVQSIAAVPVGLTSHRKGLYPLRTYRPSEAAKIVGVLEELGRRFKRRFGTRLVYASDELYIKARLQVPPAAFYEDFPQKENGVGMVAEFLRDAARTRIPARLGPVCATVISGKSFSPFLRQVLGRLNRLPGVSIRVVTVPNAFFGPAVTVTGLLTGKDIIRAVRGKRLGDILIIPANTLMDDGETFLDDRTLQNLEKAAGIPVRAAGTFREIVRALVEHQGRRTS